MNGKQDKRDVVLWVGVAVGTVAVVVVAYILSTLVRNAHGYIDRVQELQAQHVYPPPTFEISWSSRDTMQGHRTNPQQPNETVQELGERTIADVTVLMKLLPPEK